MVETVGTRISDPKYPSATGWGYSYTDHMSITGLEVHHTSRMVTILIDIPYQQDPFRCVVADAFIIEINSKYNGKQTETWLNGEHVRGEIFGL